MKATSNWKGPIIYFLIIAGGGPLIYGFLVRDSLDRIVFLFAKYWLLPGIISASILYLIGKIENDDRRRKLLYAATGFFVANAFFLLWYLLALAALGADVSILYQGFLYSLPFAAILFAIAHIRKTSFRLMTLFSFFIAILIGGMRFFM
jgi:hypothetical protein